MAGEAVIGALRADLILNTASLETGVGRAGLILEKANKSLMGTSGAAERASRSFTNLVDKFDPLSAATTRYNTVKKELDRALSAGLAPDIHAAQLARLEAEYESTKASLDPFNIALEKQNRAMEELRAKYDPIYVATKRYDAAVAELNGETARAAMSDEARAQALARLKNQLELTKVSMGTMGATAQQAGFHSTNLFFQFQDISTMLASGQSPFVLAMQQGPQIVGIFKQMEASGVSLGGGLKSALLSLVSPMSLLVVGGIAAGAALAYWAVSAFGAKEEAKSLEDVVDQLNSAQSRLDQSTDILGMSVNDLTQKYGEQADEVLRAAESMRELARAQGAQALSGALADVKGALDGFTQRAGSAFRSGTMLSDAIGSIAGRLNVTRAQAVEFERQFRALETAGDLEGQVEALRRIESLMAEASVNAADLPPELVSALQQLNELVIASGELSGGLGDAASNAAKMSAAISSARASLSGMSGDVAAVNAELRTEIQAIQAGVDVGIAQQRAEAARALEEAMAAAGGFDPSAIVIFDALNEKLDEQEELLRQREAALEANRETSSELGGGTRDLARSVDDLTGSLDANKTPFEEYLEKLAQLNNLRNNGLTDGQYADALRELNEELGKTSELSSIGENLIDSILGGGNPFEKMERQFKDSLAQMLKDAINSRIGSVLAGGGRMGGAGNILSGLFGGGGMGGGSAILGAMGGPIGIVAGIAGGIFGRRSRRRARRAEEEAALAAHLARVAEQRDRLEIRLLELQGNATEALNRSRSRELSQLDGTLHALQQRVWALEDEKKILDERKGLEEELLELQGNQAELDARWLQTLDESNRALGQQIISARAAKDAISALSEVQFATALDFARARGALAGGLRIVGGTAVNPANIASAINSSSNTSPTEVALQMTMSKILNILQNVQTGGGDALRVMNT